MSNKLYAVGIPDMDPVRKSTGKKSSRRKKKGAKRKKKARRKK